MQRGPVAWQRPPEAVARFRRLKASGIRKPGATAKSKSCPACRTSSEALRSRTGYCFLSSLASTCPSIPARPKMLSTSATPKRSSPTGVAEYGAARTDELAHVRLRGRRRRITRGFSRIPRCRRRMSLANSFPRLRATHGGVGRFSRRVRAPQLVSAAAAAVVVVLFLLVLAALHSVSVFHGTGPLHRPLLVHLVVVTGNRSAAQ